LDWLWSRERNKERKYFVISGKEQVEKFADAIEASANNRPKRVSVSANFLTDPNDIIKLMEKRKKYKC
jgi:hypothetical protein